MSEKIATREAYGKALVELGASNDKIVVLDRGAVAEEGTHRELTEKKGLYYQLVKNQLELGS